MCRPPRGNGQAARELLTCLSPVQSLIGVAVLTAAGFGLGWVNVAADYSRYLPATASRFGVFARTTFGGAIGPLVLFVYRVLLASSSQQLTSVALSWAL